MKFRTLGPKASSGCGRGDFDIVSPDRSLYCIEVARLGRGVAAVTLLAAVLTGGAALVGVPAASASTAIPPTLTGESLTTTSGTGTTSGPDVTCNSFFTPGTIVHLSVSGSAAGPYPGTFVETATFTADTFNATFTITSGSTVITGTKSPRDGLTFDCTSDFFGDFVVGPVAYNATIHTTGGDFADNGGAFSSIGIFPPDRSSSSGPGPWPADGVEIDFQSALNQPVPVNNCTTTVTGNHSGALIVPAGSTLCLRDAHQSGSIIVQRGGGLSVEHSTISGAITAYSPTVFPMCGSSTGGAVSVSGATGFVLVGDPGDDGCASNTIGGALILQNNHHGLDAIGNHVAGAVTLSGNSGAGPFPSDTGPEVSGNRP